VIGHLPDALFAEMAHIARHFHWSRSEVAALTHHERRRWVREIDRATTDGLP
jgi:hypothetical protein